MSNLNFIKSNLNYQNSNPNLELESESNFLAKKSEIFYFFKF
jgi:hypothetical protein